MASDRDEVVRDRDCLRLIVDYGSGLLKAAVQHIKAGDTPSQTRMYEVMLKPGQKVVEQKVIQLEKGRILWGRSEVQKYKRENPREAGHVIELWKLLLCPQYRDALTARRLCRAFTGQDSFNEEVMVELEDFIAGHLREVKTATLKWLYYHHPKGLQYDADYWHAVPIEFMITVPAMWGQESQRTSPSLWLLLTLSRKVSQLLKIADVYLLYRSDEECIHESWIFGHFTTIRRAMRSSSRVTAVARERRCGVRLEGLLRRHRPWYNRHFDSPNTRGRNHHGR